MPFSPAKLPASLTPPHPTIHTPPMPHPIQLQHLPARPIALVRRRLAPSQLSTVIPQSCRLVWNTIKAANITDAGRHIAIYRHAEAGLLDVEIGVELGSPFAGRDDVVASST